MKYSMPVFIYIYIYLYIFLNLHLLMEFSGQKRSCDGGLCACTNLYKEMFSSIRDD